MSGTLGTLVPQMNIKNFSGEIAEIIKEELNNKIKDGTIKTVPQNNLSPEIKKILQNTEAKNQFLSGYNNRFTATFSTDPLSAEVTLKVDKEKLGSYVNDTFKKFSTSTGGKYIDTIIAPVMGTAILSFAESAIQDFLTSKPEFDALAIAGLSYLAKQGVKVKEADEEQITNEFQKIKAQLATGDFKDTLLNEVSKKANELLKNPAGVVLSTAGNLKEQFTKNFEKARNEAKQIATSAFNSLNGDIKSLTENEIAAQTIIKQFQDNVLQRTDYITGLEKDIKRYADANDLLNLGSKQVEHAKAVAANLFQTNIINSYLKDGIGFINSIDSFVKNAENVLKGDSIIKDIETFGKSLITLKTPTFSSIATTISFASDLTDKVEDVVNIVSKLGLQGPAKTIGKFIGYAKVAIGIVGALLPPNPIGIIGAIGSLGGLFGGGGPSIEEEMFKAMQDGFNQINDRLNDIENSITNLQKMVQESYKNIMQSLTIISRKLDVIKEQLDLTDQMLYLLIYEDYNLVKDMIQTRKGIDDSGLQLYKRWYNKSPNSNILALSKLDVFINDRDNLAKVARQDFINPGDSKSYQLFKAQEKNAYDKTLILFKQLFTDINNEQAVKNLLLIPCQQNNFVTFSNGMDVTTPEVIFDFADSTDNYFNPDFVCKLVDQYITLHPFFILNKNNTPFIPVDSYDELVNNQTNVFDKLNQSINRFSNLLELINKGIIQQSIFSGNLILKSISMILYGNNEQNYQAAIDAINSNELLQKNLSVLLIHRSISDIESFYSQYSNLTNDPDKLNALNTLLVWGEGRLAFGYDAGDTGNALPCLHILKHNQNNEVEVTTKLLIPDITIIQEEQMIYSDALYNLLSAKQKVMTSIIDIQFFQGLTDNSQDSLYKDIFFLQS